VLEGREVTTTSISVGIHTPCKWNGCLIQNKYEVVEWLTRWMTHRSTRRAATILGINIEVRMTFNGMTHGMLTSMTLFGGSS
jgi:hypothetical protein